MHFAILVSQFNSEVTHGLLEGALSYLRSKEGEATWETFSAPGAFETPLIAQQLARAKDPSGQKMFDGVIVLGAVIKGDTAHFEFISLGATVGLMQAMLATETPISFGILTTYTEEQAVVRSRTTAQAATDVHLAANKGREAAAACWESLATIGLLRSGTC